MNWKLGNWCRGIDVKKAVGFTVGKENFIKTVIFARAASKECHLGWHEF
jgi:hypothetical protein